MKRTKVYQPAPSQRPPVPYSVIQSLKPLALYYKYMSPENASKLPVDVLNAFDTLGQYVGAHLAIDD